MSSWCQERKNWKASVRGRPLDIVASKTFRWSPDQKPLLILGGVHGDEPESLWLADETLRFLEQHPSANSVPWLLVPNINPDGHEVRERVNANGVDLNRNFPSRDWSKDYSKDRYFPGSNPCSEPETQAVVDIIEQFQPSCIVHYHSWQPCIVVSGSISNPVGVAFARSTGYELKEDIGYPTPGSLGNYGWNDKKIPVVCVEMPEHSLRKEIGPQFQQAFQQLFLGTSG